MLQHFAQNFVDNVVVPLSDAGMLMGIPDADREIILPESLTRVVADRPGGFSVSGREPPTPIGVPSEGYCVAVYGTDLVLENQPLLEGTNDLNPKSVAEMGIF